MLFVEFNQLTQIFGLTTLIYLLINLIFGSIILQKAINTKARLLFVFFFCIVFTSSPWFPSGYGYLFWLLTRKTLEYRIYVLLGTIFVPIAILTWLYIYLTTIKPAIRNHVLVVYGILSIIFEIYIIYFLFMAPGAPVKIMIGTFDNPDNPIDISYKGFILLYRAISILTASITGIHFSLRSMRSKNIEVMWKGRFLLLSFLLFACLALADVLLLMTPILLVLLRVLLVMATIFFYLGFILPEWLKKLLLTENL